MKPTSAIRKLLKFTGAIIPAAVLWLAAPLTAPVSAQAEEVPRARNSAMSVTLSPSLEPPAPVGTTVTMTASVSEAAPGTLWFRFRVRYLGTVLGGCPSSDGVLLFRRRCTGSQFALVRDYSPLNQLDWTPGDHEGDYEIEVSARNTDTGEVTATSTIFQVLPRVNGSVAVVSSTANSLVSLYSAPPCPAGGRMRVQFRSPDGSVGNTPFKACHQSLSMNFYLAGLRPNTTYSVKHTVDTGGQLIDSPVQTLSTGDASLTFAAYTVLQPPQVPAAEGILLHSRFGFPAATDLAGNIIWYYSGQISFLGRPEPGGLFLGLYEDQSVDAARQILREFDLAGATIRETNAARINEQLAAMGKRPITGFHHEARGLPGGGVLALASTEQILTDVQGPGPVDVLGDMILVLDRDMQLVWAWDAFDHLDPYRLATLNEVCSKAAGGCPPFYLADRANDWLHGNSLQLTPEGNILYSARHQDWVIKIDYRNGQGSGDILWRLGQDGDFQAPSGDPGAWFSHQHDANIDASGVLSLFDNGNVRFANDSTAHSRGYVLQVDEQNRATSFILNADLGAYSSALGSAQRLSTGDYHFNVGIITGNPTTSRSVEVDPSGNIVYSIQVGEPRYRSFRMGDLYSP